MSDERYRERQQRLKDKVDARVAAARDERGIVMVFTGNGKAKPPPPLAPRPAPSAMAKSRRDPVYQGDPPNGERNLLEPHGVEFQVMATGFTEHRIATATPPPARRSGSMPAVCSLTTSSIWCCWTS